MEILIVEDLIDVVPEGDFAPSTKTSMSNLTGCFTPFSKSWAPISSCITTSSRRMVVHPFVRFVILSKIGEVLFCSFLITLVKCGIFVHLSESLARVDENRLSSDCWGLC